MFFIRVASYRYISYKQHYIKTRSIIRNVSRLYILDRTYCTVFPNAYCTDNDAPTSPPKGPRTYRSITVFHRMATPRGTSKRYISADAIAQTTVGGRILFRWTSRQDSLLVLQTSLLCRRVSTSYGSSYIAQNDVSRL